MPREFEGTGVQLEVKIGTKGAARFDETVVQTEAQVGKDTATFEAKGEIERFPGWLAIYRAEQDEQKAEEINNTAVEGEEEEEEGSGGGTRSSSGHRSLASSTTARR